MKVVAHIRTDKVGSRCEKKFDIDPEEYRRGDGTLDMEAIEETAKEHAFHMMEWGFEVEE